MRGDPWLVAATVACLLWPQGRAAGAPPASADCDDADADGLCDEDEDLDGDGRVDYGETDPRVADTDGDGTPDGIERARSTDPARNGYLEFPEPMVFDLVRGLGAAQGELEAKRPSSW